jgi:sterol desaturase/sphingolipid hydroxylase (fatty acid hydroxylase superfamily)
MLTHQATIYAAILLAAFCALALWELAMPRRMLRTPKALRWLNNVCLTGTTLILRGLLFPAAGIGAALYAVQQGWGLFEYLYTPYWAAFLATLLLLDLGHWGLHYLLHRVPFLWRMHRVHHTDQDVDISTALRFHPLETGFEVSLFLILIFLLGPPLEAIVLFQLTSLLANLWSHGNLRMATWLDGALRCAFITPDMHRIHHSMNHAEAQSNYGALLSCWDRLLGTYLEEPALGQTAMTVGLEEFADPRHGRIDMMLANPLLEASEDIPLSAAYQKVSSAG